MLDSSKILYSLKDVSIVPSISSKIVSRSQCCARISDICGKGEEYLPLITAPMSTVVSDENYKTFLKNGINAIIPRNISIEIRLKLCKSVFCAFSLKELEDCFINNTETGETLYLLSDIANGHMEAQISTLSRIRYKYGSRVVLMAGNIANPKTYILYNDAGVDYLRVGIGGGKGCITSTNTGIHYPMASLIADTVDIKNNISGTTKIVADGGLDCYSDIIKCLALGADYCMIGSLLAKSLEACGDVYQLVNNKKVIIKDKEKLTKEDLKLGDYFRHYVGMSAKESQKSILGFTLDSLKNREIKTSEGRSEEMRVEYTLSGWCENFESYLKSAMSYCGSFYLNGQFSKRAKVVVISPTTSSLINNK